MNEETPLLSDIENLNASDLSDVSTVSYECNIGLLLCVLFWNILWIVGICLYDKGFDLIVVYALVKILSSFVLIIRDVYKNKYFNLVCEIINIIIYVFALEWFKQVTGFSIFELQYWLNYPFLISLTYIHLIILLLRYILLCSILLCSLFFNYITMYMDDYCTTS